VIFVLFDFIYDLENSFFAGQIAGEAGVEIKPLEDVKSYTGFKMKHVG
jgi:hypothetical protein